MFEGTYIRWSIDPTNSDTPLAHVELLCQDFTKGAVLELIQELMAVRDRLITSLP